MSVVIRETIEHHDAVRRAQDDEVGPVVILRQSPADEARIVLRLLRRSRHTKAARVPRDGPC